MLSNVRVAYTEDTKAASAYGTLSRQRGHCSWFLQKTNEEHDSTMSHPFMKSIYNQKYNRNAYGAYIWSQYQMFSTIEKLVESSKAAPALAPVYDAKLHRKEALEKDLEYFLKSRDLDTSDPKFDAIRKVTEDYVEALQKEGRDPKALLCHHFLQYNAVLSGGQYLMGRIAGKEGIDTTSGPNGWILDPSGVAFYNFDGLKSTAVRVQQYMKDMDTIELSDADREAMLPIMKRIYQQTAEAMDAAYQIAVQEGLPQEDETPIKKESPLERTQIKTNLKLTLKELRQFDGKDGGTILMGLKGKILDVTSGRESYGPGGSYSIFGGRDVTKCLALMNLSEEFLDQPDYAPEDEAGQKSLDAWLARLGEKYPEVGQVVKPMKLSLEELRKFDGRDGGRILMSLRGKIIDVTKGKESYGPGGSYSLFAGRDVTKSLALMNLSEDHLDQPGFTPDSADGKKSLDTWWSRLSGTYPEVGELIFAGHSQDYSRL